MGLQSDGKMLVAGRTHSGSGPNHRDAVIVRLLPDGSLDNAFGSGGVVRYTTVNLGCFNPEWFFDLLVLDDDRFLAAGYDQRGCDAPYRDFLVVRYQADGTVDQVFSEYPSFHGNRDEAQAVAVQADGKVLAAGWAQSVSGQDATTDVAVARWNPDGTLDTSFDGEGEWLLDVNGDMDRIDAVVVQPDGKIVLAGQTRVNDQTDWLVIRLHPDGSWIPPSMGTACSPWIMPDSTMRPLACCFRMTERSWWVEPSVPTGRRTTPWSCASTRTGRWTPPSAPAVRCCWIMPGRTIPGVPWLARWGQDPGGWPHLRRHLSSFCTYAGAPGWDAGCPLRR